PDIVEFQSEGQLLKVYTNYSTAAAFGFRFAQTLSDSNMSPRAPDTRTTQAPSITAEGIGVISHDRVWRKAIDVNGDGRIDIIDAAEQAGHWVVYLNTPDATDPTVVHWEKRSFSVATLSQQLASHGMTEGGFVPLSRTAIGIHGLAATCYEFTVDLAWEPARPG